SSRREIILRDLVLSEWDAEDRLKAAAGIKSFARRADDEIRSYLKSLGNADFLQWRYFDFGGQEALHELEGIIAAQASHYRRIPLPNRGNGIGGRLRPLRWLSHWVRGDDPEISVELFNHAERIVGAVEGFYVFLPGCVASF